MSNCIRHHEECIESKAKTHVLAEEPMTMYTMILALQRLRKAGPMPHSVARYPNQRQDKTLSSSALSSDQSANGIGTTDRPIRQRNQSF